MNYFLRWPIQVSLKIVILNGEIIAWKMKVIVNATEVSVFEGAKARDAVFSYFRSMQTVTPEPFPLIFDQFGNIIEPDGELSENNQLFTITTNNSNNYE